jgi:hypothetical protein
MLIIRFYIGSRQVAECPLEEILSLTPRAQMEFWTLQAELGRTWKPTGRAVCAWCGTDLGERDGIPPGIVSHGICQACADREKKHLTFV